MGTSSRRAARFRTSAPTMIDLHVHTTASDGRSTPELLIQQVRAAGIHTLAVADHDTVQALAETAALAGAAGVRFVPGIEITAVHNGKDVHVLGYWFDAGAPELLAFLSDSRADRLRRAHEMGTKLAALGAPVDMDALIGRSGGANSGKAIARPDVARELVNAGHCQDVQEAFDRYLSNDAPAYVPRVGASPADVIGIIRRAGGIASLAHPGPLGKDGLVPELARAGLAAIECYHSEHAPDVTARYLELAARHGLAVSGGSDFHGEGTRRAESFGRVSLPPEHFDALHARAERV